MKISVISDALPLGDGDPAQREATRFREWLERHFDVSWITIDTDGTQWPMRSRIDADVQLMPFARVRPNSAVSRGLSRARVHFNKPQAEQSAFWSDLEKPAALTCGWLSTRRIDRLATKIEAFGPDVLLIDGVTLADLAKEFRGMAKRSILRGKGEIAIREALFLASNDADTAHWHQIATDQMRSAIRRNVLHLDAIWGDDEAIAAGRDNTDLLFQALRPFAPQPVLPTSKIGREVLVCETDLRNLRLVHQEFRARGTEHFNTTAIGPGAGIKDPPAFTTIAPGWTDLTMNLALASAVYVPTADRVTSGMLEEALASGVPVVADRSAAARSGLNLADGIVVADTPTQAAVALTRLLEGPQNDQAKVLLSRAKDRYGASEEAYALAFAQLVGEAPAPISKGDAIRTRTQRLSPFAAKPEILYTAPTGMLMARLTLRTSALVTEVRLSDSERTELCRFLPNSGDGRQASRVVEGGGIVEAGPVVDGIWISVFAAADCIGEMFVGGEDVVQIACEIASLDFDDPTQFSGVLWVKQDALATDQRLFLDELGMRLPLPKSQPVPMDDIGISAVPFRVPMDQSATVGRPLTFSAGSTRIAAKTLPQRPFHLTKLITNHRSGPDNPVTALKDIHAGQRGWIIGNGPSVRLEDLDRIPKDDIVFVFNRFYLAHEDTSLREDYLFSGDTLMIKDFGQEMIERSPGRVFLSQSAKDSGILQDIEGDFLSLTQSDNPQPFFSYRVDDFVSLGGSSVFMALQVAHFMGLRDLCLYGLDYSFSMKPKRDPRYRFPVSFDEGNHFIKNYRSDKPWCPPTWRDISAGFLNARVAIEARGGQVRNVTRGGRLETFQRASFDDLV